MTFRYPVKQAKYVFDEICRKGGGKRYAQRNEHDFVEENVVQLINTSQNNTSAKLSRNSAENVEVIYAVFFFNRLESEFRRTLYFFSSNHQWKIEIVSFKEV